MINLLKDKLLTVKNKKILELGTGYVENIHFEIAKVNDLTISDIVPIRIEPGARPVPFINITADACSTDLKKETFDIVASSMLVQHLDPEKHFNEVRRILKDNGVYWFACTGSKHNQELHHPDSHRLNVDADEFSKYGVSVIAEELYTTTESLSVTKHYYLFEMSR